MHNTFIIISACLNSCVVEMQNENYDFAKFLKPRKWHLQQCANVLDCMATR